MAIAAFFHPIGISTFKYGISVPKACAQNFHAPKRGRKKLVTVLYGKKGCFTATFRTSDNSAERIHLRYKKTITKVLADLYGHRKYLLVNLINKNTFQLK